jgi:Flp pilus assembly protein TadD
MHRLLVLCVLALAACGSTTTGLSPDKRTLDMARAALRGGSPQTTLQILADASSRGAPVSVAALVLQGDALTALGRPDEAQIAYDSALKQNTKAVGALIGLGRLKLGSDPAAAETYFLAATQADPNSGPGWNNLGIARDLQGHHEGAQIAYRQCLGIDPQNSAAVVNLALSLAMGGRADEGVRILGPLATSANASVKMRHDYAVTLALAGRQGEAEEILSADLSPEEVRQALDSVNSARGSF